MNILNKIKSAPKQPGCYLFKNSAGKVIYVGKAKDISKRVPWYFKKENQDGKTAKLVSQISDVEFIVTDNEVEALILESTLIRKHQPRYNIDLKSGVRYAYVRITKEKFPRLETTRLPKKNEKIFGPYVSGAARAETVHLANNLFKLRVCRRLPKRACLLYHIHLCSAPCINKISEDDYQANVAKAELLLKGKSAELVKQLEQEMKDFSDTLDYESARIRRDQISALQNIAQRQKVSLQRRYNQDVINFVAAPNKIYIQLFNINKGIISGRKQFAVKTPLGSDSNQNLADFIRQYYFENDIPQEIIVPGHLPEEKVLEQYLTKLAKGQIKILVPQKGDKAKLLDLVKRNIAITLQAGESSALELQEKLSLPSLPRVIECFDISNLGAAAVVGSLVHFKDGRPDKNHYRRFKIKTVAGQSDFDCMKEIVFRRYYGLLKDQGRFPDLVMVDGGKPQLSAATAALRELGLTLPLIALAKKEEEIYTLNNQYPLRLPKTSAALKLLQRVRNEAHRFAITYHRLLRSRL